ncbi:sensor histidine kinase [Streptomyces sp. NPDC051940]|uniref:sensor histidine kinase n=1 Tax=Streptomyces sp. NPDC051940 TaxID=3155675 RepID=UPI00341A0A37
MNRENRWRSGRLRAAVARAGRAARSRPWAVDALLALVLAVGVVSTDLDRSWVELQDRPAALWQSPGDAPAPPKVPAEPDPWNEGVPEPTEPVEPIDPLEQERLEGQGVRICPPSDPLGEVHDCLPVGAQVRAALEQNLPPVQWWELALGVLAVAPLALRRRYPLGALWAVLAGVSLFHVGEVSTDATAVTFAAVLIAAYSAVMYSRYRKAAVGSLLAAVALLWRSHLVPDVDRGWVPLLVLVPVALAANALHAWQQRARRLQQEQQAATRRAVDEERQRIARELHDVVTHNVSMMTIQAGAARKVLDAEPDQAREAMLAVETAGRTAMAELRQVMGLLTMAAEGPDPAGTADLAPQPGLARLTELVEGVRATGSAVSVRTEGDAVPLPSGVDLAAYRVVQEALTNAVKHASGADITVTVAYAPDELRIAVEDDGGVPLPAEGNGRGLMGLRERLSVYGGTLQTGKRPRGGYRVRAVIPLEVP